MTNRHNILLVEPERVLAEITAFRLELLGYHVHTVTNAAEALGYAQDKRPDLIITDLQLESSDALPLIEQLGSGDATSHIPIIVLSVDADLERVHMVYTAGAQDFLVVPYHPGALEEKVARHLAPDRVANQESLAVAAARHEGN
jgi:DNA-binding response OmpR family regulator